MNSIRPATATYGVIDLFAGPGGLGEGFASLVENGRHPFRVGISVEKEKSAYQTLRLRAFLREVVRTTGNLPEEYVEFHAGLRPEPDWSEVNAAAWEHACGEARWLELGTAEAATLIDREVDRIRGLHRDTVLMGGPPCQAYSLVGRARSRGNVGYRPEEDGRHFLFQEYIRVLDRLRPAAFVLENVKGVLSSKVGARRIFEEILEDLSSLGGAGVEAYQLRALRLEGSRLSLEPALVPSDFIVRAERFGVPQRRHRVIIIGIRSDLVDRADRAGIELPSTREVTVAEVIGDLPTLRSGLSRTRDTKESWEAVVLDAAGRLGQLSHEAGDEDMSAAFARIAAKVADGGVEARQGRHLPKGYGTANDALRRWLENDELVAVAQHETRGHIPADLERYLFASVFGAVRKQSAKKSHYPAALAPNHRSWERGVFSDRFRAQLAHEPSTTIVSHISKDGHYFIHPDPAQCRSLTVREAARLQTFPDDYLFLGNRTQQYVQVGNAVPPYLARQIAQLLLDVVEGSEIAGVGSSALEAEPALS